jgi:hypothetical protein
MQEPRAPGIDCRGVGVKETVPHCGYWFCSSRLLYVLFTRNYTRQAAYLLLPLPCTSLSLFRGQRCRNAASVPETHRIEPPKAAVTRRSFACVKYYFSDGKRNHITSLDGWMSNCLKPYSSALYRNIFVFGYTFDKNHIKLMVQYFLL